MYSKPNAFALTIVIIISVILAVIGMSVLILAEQEAILTKIDADRAGAFYMAEAGLAKVRESLQQPSIGDVTEFLSEPYEGSLDRGRFSVELVTIDSNNYLVSTGFCGKMQKQVRVKTSFLAPPFEDAVYARNQSGGAWAYQLRGKNNSLNGEVGGKDIINGNIAVDGDVALYENSAVRPSPMPNKWNLRGNVRATGSIGVFDSASISGSVTPHAPKPATVDLVPMNYAENCTHNVSNIFAAAKITSGYLPGGNELRDIFVKNPSDRRSECDTTTTDDYFLEPRNITILGTPKDGSTPLNLGIDRVYYVDGDVWVHSPKTYGFKIDGKATIVATGDIHISDNLQYKNSENLLGFVALGKYDSAGKLISGGDIYFGDPRFGTMFTVSAMMFAANDFLYNSDSVTREPAEPTSGFIVTGCIAALNHVSIERDWYNSSGKMGSGSAKPAIYDPVTSSWVDSKTKSKLSTTQKNSLRHYPMIINYDDRVRNPQTQPPQLPRGTSSIFAGFAEWEEI